MGIKFDDKKQYWIAFYSKRHPITRKPQSLMRKGFKTKAEALRAEKDLVLQMDQKLKKVIVPSWDQVIAEYSEDLGRRDVSRKTVETYSLCLKAYTSDIWGTRLVDEISAHQIRELIRDRAQEKSPSHQKNILKYIRGALDFAVEKGYIQVNPTPKMKFKIGDKLKSVLTKEQVKILLNQAKVMDCEWYPIWAMALYTGMRNGELYALTWDKVNLEQRSMLVSSSWSIKDGYKDTKSGDDRIVEIAPELLVILRDLKIKSFGTSFVLPRIDKWDRESKQES